MKKNVASQIVGAQLINASTGAAVTTGTTTVYVTGDGGTQAAGSVGSGACTHEGQGYWTYAPAQAETNYDQVAFTFTNTSAVPVTVQVYTQFPQTGDAYARLGAPAGASVSADVAAVKTDTAAILVDTGTTLDARIPAALVSGRMDCSVGAMASGVVTATAIAADAIGASELAADAASEIGTAVWATAARTLTANTNLNDPTAATIAAAVWDLSTTGHTTSGTFGEQVKTDIDAILVDTAEIGAAGAGLTAINLPDQTMNITGDITGNLSGSVGSVTGAVGSVTGNVGGNVAGSVGSVTGAVGSVTGAVGSVTGNVGGNVTGSVGSLATQAKADVNAEVVDALTVDIIADSIPADGTRPSVAQAAYMLVQFMNERSVSGTTVTVKKVDGSTSLFTLTLNDATTPTSITRAT